MAIIRKLKLNKKPNTSSVLVLVLSLVLFLFSILSSTSPNLNPSLADTDYAPVSISATLNLLEEHEFPSKIRLSDFNILASKLLINMAPSGTETICIKEATIILKFFWNDNSPHSIASADLLKPNQPVCQPMAWFDEKSIYSGFITSSSYTMKSKSLQLDIDPYFYYQYPFEKIKSTITTKVQVDFLDNKNQLIVSKEVPSSVMLMFLNRLTSWKIQVTDNLPAYMKSDDSSISGSPHYLLFRRPTLLVFLCSIFIFIVFVAPVLFPLSKSRSEILGVALTYLLGIWVFRGVLLPSKVVVSGLLDLLFISGCLIAILSTSLALFGSSDNDNLDQGPLPKLPKKKS